MSNFWATVCKRFAICYQAVVCPVCLSCPVSNVGVLWPNGWMNQDETWHTGLGLGHIVLDGDPAPLPRGAQPPILALYLSWPNVWMDQDATW